MHLVQRGMSPNSYDFHKLSNRSSGAYFPRIMTVPGSSFSASHFREHYNRSQKTRRLGVNATQFGPALTSSEYKTYFLVREVWFQCLSLVYCQGFSVWLHKQLFLFFLWISQVPKFDIGRSFPETHQSHEACFLRLKLQNLQFYLSFCLLLITCSV
jgi:hypothetical protein